MGKRKVVIKKSVAVSIAKISLFIESKGMLATAERFSDSAYDFFQRLSSKEKTYPICRDPNRASLGFKCVRFGKYPAVFIEAENEITICEFIPSKLIWW